MDIPRPSKPNIVKLSTAKLNGWTLVAMSVLALVVLGAILIQMFGTDIAFPKLAHKTSYFTADDGTVSVFSRDVRHFIGIDPIADGLQAATKWLTHSMGTTHFFDPYKRWDRERNPMDQEDSALDTMAGPRALELASWRCVLAGKPASGIQLFRPRADWGQWSVAQCHGDHRPHGDVRWDFHSHRHSLGNYGRPQRQGRCRHAAHP